MHHFKAFGIMNLQYKIRICHKIQNKGKMRQLQMQVTIFLSGTDVTLEQLHRYFIELQTNPVLLDSGLFIT